MAQWVYGDQASGIGTEKSAAVSGSLTLVDPGVRQTERRRLRKATVAKPKMVIIHVDASGMAGTAL